LNPAKKMRAFQRIAEFHFGSSPSLPDTATQTRAVRVGRWMVWLLALALPLGLGMGCSRSNATSPQGAGKRGAMAVPVTVAVAAQKNVPVELDTIGCARAYASVSIKARVDGQLAQVCFHQGEEVKKGAQIFLIDPRPFQAALDQAEAVLARDIASLRNAETDMRRTDELEGSKAVPATLIDSNRAKEAALRATVQADKAAIESAKLQVSFCSIVSPVNGRVGLLLVDEGNIVKNNDTILAVVNQTRPIYVDFALPEQFLLDVRTAAGVGKLRVEAALPQRTDAHPIGQLEVINNQVDSTTGTILLRAAFPNLDEILWPGQLLNMTLTMGELANATVVPAQAVQSSQSGEFVFAVKADLTVEKRPVTLGPSRAGEVVLKTGMQPGETVVTDGQMRLVPGTKVDVKATESVTSGQAGKEKST
jgi:membrane fusion protein, multidrug efflux system